MCKIVLDGEVFSRDKVTWVDESGYSAPSSLLQRLNHAYFDQYLRDYQTLDYKRIREEAHFFKENGSPSIALEMLLILYKKQHDDIKSLQSFLSTITSCYRMVGQPEKAIAFYREVFAIYGYSIETADLLTSVAAAYLDLHDCKNAKKCCNKAYAMSDGRPSGELTNVYRRLHSECQLE